MDPLAVVTDVLRTLWTAPEHLSSGQAFIAIMVSVVIVSGVFNVLTMVADIGETVIEAVIAAIARMFEAVFRFALSPRVSEERTAAYLDWCERNGEVPFRIAGSVQEYAKWTDPGILTLTSTYGNGPWRCYFHNAYPEPTTCPGCKTAIDWNDDDKESE